MTDKLKDAKSDYQLANEKYGLSRKQYEFANNYILSNNGLQSAKQAGYAGNDKDLTSVVAKLKKNNSIRQYMDDKRLKLEQKSKNNINRTMEDVISKYWELIENTTNDSVRRSALADVGKIYGGFAPAKIEIESNVMLSETLQAARMRIEKLKEPGNIT